jgi:hypothetical protein
MPRRVAMSAAAFAAFFFAALPLVVALEWSKPERRNFA